LKKADSRIFFWLCSMAVLLTHSRATAVSGGGPQAQLSGKSTLGSERATSKTQPQKIVELAVTAGQADAAQRRSRLSKSVALFEDLAFEEK
jgi:hypothetical protein